MIHGRNDLVATGKNFFPRFVIHKILFQKFPHENPGNVTFVVELTIAVVDDHQINDPVN